MQLQRNPGGMSLHGCGLIFLSFQTITCLSKLKRKSLSLHSNLPQLTTPSQLHPHLNNSKIINLMSIEMPASNLNQTSLDLSSKCQPEVAKPEPQWKSSVTPSTKAWANQCPTPWWSGSHTLKNSVSKPFSVFSKFGLTLANMNCLPLDFGAVTPPQHSPTQPCLLWRVFKNCIPQAMKFIHNSSHEPP